MINIFNDLAELNIPVYAEGDAPETLPNAYFTVSEDATTDHISADNEVKAILYEYTLKYYTNDATTLYSKLIEAMQLLKSKNYITTGVGYANSTYKETYFSRQADIKKIDYLD